MGKEREADTRRASFHHLTVSAAPDAAMVERKLGDLALHSDLRIRFRVSLLNFVEDEVRKDGAITLEQAVRRLTSRPAEVFGLADRGHLAVGLPADVVVFHPRTVGAGALERVHDLPAGEDRLISRPKRIKAVIVNGSLLPEPVIVPDHAPDRLLRQRRAA